MFPDQQNQNSGQPQPVAPYQPPAGGAGSPPVPEANGQYAVVPPLPVGQNNGHSGHNPYEFIVNPQQAKSSRGSLFGGSSFMKQIAVIVGLAVIVIVVLAIGVSLLAPKSNTGALSGIAERQQEIVRVATEAAGQAAGQDAKNFTTNTELSVASSQAQLLAYLKNHGVKPSAKQLALDQSSQTDTLLTNAAAANTYDTVAVQNLTGQLQTYQSQLQTAYKQTTSQQVKQLLQASYSTAALLLEQAKAVHTQ